MQEIISIVETLLFEHDCVIVPEFGGFLLQQSSAQIVDGVLLPPRVVVAFNRQLRHDDGLLVSVYARRQGVNQPSAKREVARRVVQMAERLQASGVLRLGRFGEMRMEDDRWFFVPAMATFLPQNLGMPTLYPQKRLAEQVITIRLHKQTLHYAAACALGLCLFAFPPKSGDASLERYAGMNPVNYTEILRERQAAETAAQEARLAEETARLQRRKECHFHIVVAQLNKAAAEEYASQLLTEGHEDAFVLKYKRNQYRVVVASYRTKRAALQQMQALRRQTAYRRAWVYCEK